MWADRAREAKQLGRLPPISPMACEATTRDPPRPPDDAPNILPNGFTPNTSSGFMDDVSSSFNDAASRVPTDEVEDTVHISSTPLNPSELPIGVVGDLTQLLPPTRTASPSVDPALVQLLCPLQQPTPSYTAFTASETSMRYFAHYLSIILPFQWPFERAALSAEVTPMAFTDPVVFETLTALGALHMGSRRGVSGSVELGEAEGALLRSVRGLQLTPVAKMGRHEVIVAAMGVASFYLFAGGHGPGWRGAIAMCRRCLAAVAYGGDLAGLRHLLAPLMWVDVMTALTEGTSSAFLGLHRLLVPNSPAQGRATEGMGQYLRETVMGCDSTTRLALAETLALSEWKEAAQREGRLSVRELLRRADGVERILAQRAWSEAHLAQSDPHRRAVSDVFFRAVRVLLATVVNGPYPAVPEVREAVHGVAEAFVALDEVGAEMDRALVFPIVIAGCHATAELRARFEERFHKVGPDAEFGNTRNALKLMKAVWARRDDRGDREEVHWREVMYELYPEGLLLI